MVNRWLKTPLLPGLPGGSVVKNPPAEAQDRDLIPWSRKIPHPLEQQSLGAETTEAQVPQSPGSATEEATAMGSPCSATRGQSPPAPVTGKKKKKKA